MIVFITKRISFSLCAGGGSKTFFRSGLLFPFWPLLSHELGCRLRCRRKKYLTMDGDRPATTTTLLLFCVFVVRSTGSDDGLEWLDLLLYIFMLPNDKCKCTVPMC